MASGALDLGVDGLGRDLRDPNGGTTKQPQAEVAAALEVVSDGEQVPDECAILVGHAV